MYNYKTLSYMYKDIPLGKYTDDIVVSSPFPALLYPDTVILISSHGSVLLGIVNT